MKNGGFTLIELLGVIVILAILALIATPIVLGIVNDTREEGKKRSVELYADAVNNAVFNYQIVNKKRITGTFTTTDGKILTKVGTNQTLEVEFAKSKVVCTTIEINSIGEINLTGCQVGDSENRYKYRTTDQNATIDNTPVVTTTRYYSWSDGSITTGLPEDANEVLSNVEKDRDDFYLAFDSTDGESILAAYVCFSLNNEEYCLQGGDSGLAFDDNKDILDTAYENIANACTEGNNSYECESDNYYETIAQSGEVSASMRTGFAECIINANGNFSCFATPIID